MDFERLRKIRPLIIEDEKDAMRSLFSVFDSVFDVFYTARNGEEGLYRFYKEHPDIVITDLEMPFMGGFRMLERIRMEYPLMPLIVTSAHSQDSHINKAQELGVNGYLVKPFDIEALFEKVFELCCTASDKIDLDAFSL
jgi:YesN/AraC family two-component response regulator